RIWQRKSQIANPLLCEEDGPVYQLRRWYEQFYVDRDKVEPEMQERFEFEVDTTAANQYWEAEVAENMRRQDAGEAEISNEQTQYTGMADVAGEAAASGADK
ncbi:MAG: 3-ketosteroid-9-alpha-hydroxylase, partial [Dietzia cercidiphylli]